MSEVMLKNEDRQEAEQLLKAVQQADPLTLARWLGRIEGYEDARLSMETKKKVTA